jgi:hypothetical protein
MKLKFKRITLVLLTFLILLLTVSCDGKKPQKGYISEERLLEIASGFKNVEYEKYNASGYLHYFTADTNALKPEFSLDTPYLEYNQSPKQIQTGLNLYSYEKVKSARKAGQFVREKVVVRYLYADEGYCMYDKTQTEVQYYSYMELPSNLDINNIVCVPKTSEMTISKYTNPDTNAESLEPSKVVVNNYAKYAASYYLCLPLHLTYESFTETSINWSSRYALEARVYRQQGTDQIYYYERPEGGFILKCFAVNKELLITNYALWEESQTLRGFEWGIDSIVDCSCSGKWNITVEYDANGYLVSEKFETINVSEKNLDTCCYGQATYNYN